MPVAKFLREKTLRECQKAEYVLDIDDYGGTLNYEGILSIAKLIQNLLFLEPNTYPNHPGMGIGIRLYQFEYIDDKTINELKINILDQVKKYIDENIVLDVNISRDATNRKALLIGFELERVNYNEPTIFTLQLVQSNKETISNIYI